MLFFQSSTAAPVAATAHSDPGALSLMPFSIDFFIHAIAIWVALIVICVIVFAYRRRGKEDKGGFQDTYHQELDAMRRGRSDQRDETR